MPGKSQYKKACVALLALEKREFKSKHMKWNKEGFIVI